MMKRVFDYTITSHCCVQAPDWVDAEECHRCRVQFGVMTRKVGRPAVKLGHTHIFMALQQAAAAVVSVC